MADEFKIIVLEYPFTMSSIVNDFLHETGLHEDFVVVMAEVEYCEYWQTDEVIKKGGPNLGGIIKKGGPEMDSERTSRRTRVGLEPLNEEANFYWMLKGHDTMRATLEDYISTKRYNKGVS